jgi:hypothetical protein
MGVDVELRDEEGRQMERIGDPDYVLSESLPSSEDGYEWLSTVDDHADTTFNSVQVRRLLPELERRASEVDPAAAALYGEVKRLALVVRDTPHVYLVFIGD